MKNQLKKHSSIDYYYFVFTLNPNFILRFLNFSPKNVKTIVKETSCYCENNTNKGVKTLRTLQKGCKKTSEGMSHCGECDDCSVDDSYIKTYQLLHVVSLCTVLHVS